MRKVALIIGGNGRLGQVLAAALVAAGWRVHAQVRRLPDRTVPGVHWIDTPLSETAHIAQAVHAADVVIHAANPLYTQWRTEARALMQQAIDVARRLSALMMFAGNVYNFGARMPEILLEDTAQNPTTRKGRIRVGLEKDLREAAGAGLRSVTIRAGDFFGGPGRGSWFDLVVVKSLRKGIAIYPGPLHAVHAWAYLPDLARAFVMVAEKQSLLPMFTTLHFEGHSLTGQELLDALGRSARRQGLVLPNVALRQRSLPWPLLRAAGLVMPMMREIAEMRYLWSVPHRLSGQRLEQLVGKVPVTPLEQALDETLRQLFG
jgi:nucleoside-diphosphate-sugar epimerase